MNTWMIIRAVYLAFYHTSYDYLDQTKLLEQKWSTC